MMGLRRSTGRNLRWALAASTTLAGLAALGGLVVPGGVAPARADGGRGGASSDGASGGAGGTGYTGGFSATQNGGTGTSGYGAGGGGGSAGGGFGGAGGGSGANAGGQGGSVGVGGTLDGAAGGDSPGNGGGGGGQGGFNAFTGPTLTGGPYTGGTGGGGGNVRNSGAFAGAGGGGAGGYAAVVTGSGSAGNLLVMSNGSAFLGGGGGAGGTASNASSPFAGGAGGDGGIGAFFSGGYVDVTNTANATITGGNGGTGGYGNAGGGGGAGGVGVSFAGTGASLTNTATITGGTGGNAGNAAGVGGGGGVGGAGVSFAGPGASLTNTAAITGGTGGTGGIGNSSGGGVGGVGGAGVSFAGPGASLTNTAAITGGNGGNGGDDGAGGGSGGGGGAGGAGVIGGGLTITNAGTITGGAGGSGGRGRVGPAGAAGNAISFTGGTNRLELQAATAGGLYAGITGNVVVQTGNGATGTLALGGTRDKTFDASLLGPTAQYQGFTAYEKTGTSSWTLTGTSTLTTPWSVNGGILNVTGSLGSAPFSVASGGILAGAGTVGGLSVASGGIVHPGAVAAVPTILNVSGNVSFAAGSTFRVTLTPTTTDQIIATGTATLSGGTVDVRAGSGTYGQTTYTLISATGGVTGTFTNLTTTSNLAFRSPTLQYSGTLVNLALMQTAPVTSVASTPNQTSTGTAVQAAVPAQTTPAPTTATQPATPAAAPTTATQPATPAAAQTTTTQPAAATTTPATPAAQVAIAVLNQTVPGAVQALNSLSGEIHASAVTAVAQTAFAVEGAILDRLRFGEGGGLGFGGPGLTGTIGQRFAPGTTLPAAYSADVPGGPVIGLVPVRSATPNYALWGQGFGAFGSTGSDKNAARLTRQTGGFVLGLESGFEALSLPGVTDLRVGVAAGYSFTSLAVTSRQSTGQVESGFGAVYARGALEPVQVRLGAAYAGNALDTRRTVIFPGFSQAVSGKAGGDTAQGFGEVGYRVGSAAGHVEPFVGGAALHIRRDGFSEAGGASALTVFGRSYDIATVTAGVQAQAVLSEVCGGAGPLMVRGLVGYRRAFGDVVPQALLAFGGGGQAFLTAGVPVARDAAVASAGLDWQVARNTTLGLTYAGQVGDRAQDHALKGSFSYRW